MIPKEMDVAMCKRVTQIGRSASARVHIRRSP